MSSYQRGPQFLGNMDMLTHTHPVRVGGRYPREAGFPLGNDTNGIPRQFDHVQMRDSKSVTTPLLMILGDIGSGKTTLGMRLLLHVLMTSVRAGKRARIAADTTKRSGGMAEWTQFVEEIDEKTIDLSADFRDGINILDPELPLKEQDHLRNLSELMQDDAVALDVKEEHVLRVGLHRILAGGNPHITKLNELFATLTVDDYTCAVHELQALSGGVSPRVSQEDLNAICQTLYFRLSNLINGKTGQVLGGRGSLAEAMSRMAVSFDYTLLDPDAIAPVQSFVWRVKTAAIRYGDNRFFCDAELHDENYESWDSMSYALSMRSRTKKLRGTGSLLIMVSQHISDYFAISGPQGKLAQNMLRDVGMWMIAQHDVEDLPLIREHCGLSAEVAMAIPYLRPGQFVAKIGSQAPFIFDYKLTDLYRRISDTDIATKRNLLRGA